MRPVEANWDGQGTHMNSLMGLAEGFLKLLLEQGSSFATLI